MISSLNSQSALKQHWFWPAAMAVFCVNTLVILLDGWHSSQIKEFGVLFDFAVLIPLLYLICYRAGGKKTLIRAIAFACLGIWLAAHIVPDHHHAILNDVVFLRYIGLAVLIAIQIRLGIEIYRLAFRSATDAETSDAIQQKAEQEGIPPWVARLMAWESRVWRSAWVKLRARFWK